MPTKEEKYYAIIPTEDGAIVRVYNRETIEKELNEKYSGLCDVGYLSEDDVIKESDPNDWGDNNILIIKGNVVIPKDIKVVTKREVE